MSVGLLKVFTLQELKNAEQTGYSLISRMQEVLGKRPSSGTIYPMLQSLVKKGVITFRQEQNRKYYSLTAQGKKTIDSLLQEKEKALRNAVDCLQTIEDFSDESEVRSFKESLLYAQQSHDVLLDEYAAGLLRIKHVLLRLMQQKDASVRSHVNTVLHKTAQSLESLERKVEVKSNDAS
jgi:DNA-binding PadR family transcriptional regulator